VREVGIDQVAGNPEGTENRQKSRQNRFFSSGQGGLFLIGENDRGDIQVLDVVDFVPVPAVAPFSRPAERPLFDEGFQNLEDLFHNISCKAVGPRCRP